MAGTVQDAIRRLRMGSAVKLLLAFCEPFWPAGLWDAVCPGAFLPEVWVTSYPPAATGARQHFTPHPSPSAPCCWGILGVELTGRHAFELSLFVFCDAQCIAECCGDCLHESLAANSGILLGAQHLPARSVMFHGDAEWKPSFPPCKTFHSRNEAELNARRIQKPATRRNGGRWRCGSRRLGC